MTKPRHLVLQDIPLPEQLRLARDLPQPDECIRAREAAGVSQDRFAREFLRVQPATLKSWETQRRAPQFRHRVLWSLRIRELRAFLAESAPTQASDCKPIEAAAA